MSKTLAVVIGALVFIALWALIFQTTGREWRILRQLARSGVQVIGAVTAKEPMNHATLRYEYYVGGVRYSGGPCRLAVPGAFDRTKIGDQIDVTYLPASPETSTCGDAKAAYSARSGIVLGVEPLFALFAATLAGFALYWTF